MNLDRTYIIATDPDPDDEIDFSVTRSAPDVIFIRHGSSKMAIGEDVAQKLKLALSAVLSGSFDEAATEKAIRVRLDREARARAAVQESQRDGASAPATPSRNHIPTLGDL